jgi:hypothetical protein
MIYMECKMTITRPPRDFTIHPYRLSDSAINTLLECERHFQIDRLLQNVERGKFERSPETVRGQAYGVGIQTYMLTGDMDQALFDAWQAYWPMLEDPPKTFEAKTLNNLQCSKEALDRLRNEYAVAIFDGEPAIELSFRLNLDSKWYYVGYIDLVLQHKETGVYGVLEVKTTGSKYKDLRPMYQYSGQALGYSIILDQIAGAEQTEFTTPYLVCQDSPTKDTWTPNVHLFPFKWALLDRFKWFMTRALDLQRLNMMLELNMFPQRQKGCLAYGRICPHFGLCSLTAGDQMREIPEDKNVYQFVYNLEEVIADHVKRIHS